ncbi:hypothetical protein [Bartonella sp. CB60]|uniref:hypothetical protein n=1 Tax=Bartonella sp. CB60 TaxID=3113619 RepID=UPI00300E3057
MKRGVLEGVPVLEGALLEAWGAWGISVLEEHCLKRGVLEGVPVLEGVVLEA